VSLPISDLSEEKLTSKFHSSQVARVATPRRCSRFGSVRFDRGKENNKATNVRAPTPMTTDDAMETGSYNLSVDDGDSETYRTTPSTARPSPLGRFVRSVRGEDDDEDGVVETSGRSRVVRWIVRGVKVVAGAVFGLYLVGLAASGEDAEEGVVVEGDGASAMETREVRDGEARERRAMQTAAEAPTHPRVAYVPQAKTRQT